MRSDVAAVYERMSMETVDPAALATTERTVGHSVYGGSVVGVSLRVEDAVTAGSIVVNVKVDGVTKLTATLDTTNSTSRVVRQVIGIGSFEADKNISVEYVPSSYDNSGSVPSAVTVQVHLTNSGLVTQSDRVVARTVLSADATTLSVTGLKGDLDEEYEIEGNLFLSLSANNLTLAPNGDTANLGSRRVVNGGNSSSGDGLVLVCGASSTRNQFHFRCIARVGRSRNGVAQLQPYEFTGARIYNTSPLIDVQHVVIGYYTSAAELTFLDFTSSVASGILTGSEIVVRRVKA
jgi:hypothetical protein